jgi:hypothetical protein
VEIATSEGVGFADVFWPMLNAGFEGRKRYGTNYNIAGGDGVHPGWAGHVSMAYAFLKSFGLDGEIGIINVDLKSGQAAASKGHEVLAAKAGSVEIKSSRYPFCATGESDKDGSIRSAMTLLPFNQELNRLTLVAKNGAAQKYKVTWGKESKSYSAAQLAQGVNLAADFAVNPFSDAFKKVDAAVIAKQSYETRQIKQLFHDLPAGKYSTKEDRCKALDTVKDAEVLKLFATCDGGKFNPDAIATETEKTRAPLAAAVKTAFVPVTHTIQIEAE